MGETWQGIVAEVRRTRTQRGRQSSGKFSIEGIRLHERAVRSGSVPLHVVISRELASNDSERVVALLDELRSAGSLLQIAPATEIDRLTEGRGLGDIVGLVRMNCGAASDRFPSNAGPVVVAVDIFDPGNCGALVRTALAGSASLFVAAGQTDPYHPRAVQTSMGSLFKIPILRRPDVAAGLEELRQEGFRLAGMSCSAQLSLPDSGIGNGRVAVVMGSESDGLDDGILGSLDIEVRIPMPDGVDSFSVNAAAAIVLYEIARTSSS